MEDLQGMILYDGEKVVKKMPYYIEVLRNQNVVIIYGLDSNNNYTQYSYKKNRIYYIKAFTIIKSMKIATIQDYTKINK